MDYKIDEKIRQAAATVPRIFIDASLGDGDENNREPGIQLTKEQIISLRKYETLGLSLPIRLADVITYLNYGAGDNGSAGLTPVDFQRTFLTTYNHSKTWSPLRRKIMLTGTELKIFASSILLVGRGIMQVYTELRASRYLEEHNINTPEEYQKLRLTVPDLPPLDLPPGDIPEIKDYLKGMQNNVISCHAKAASVRGELDVFGKDMREKVLPAIKLRLKAVTDNTYQADIQELQKEIDARSLEIDELNKQYNQMVQEAIKAAASLNIGGLILGIYQGVKAEELRRKRKQVEAQQDAANQKMASKNKTLSSLNRVRGDLQNLNYVAVEAEAATQNLMLVWSALNLYLDESLKNIDNVKNATSLRRFINHIESVISPWERIQSSSDELIRVFNEADKEYERGNLMVWGKTKMFTGFSASGYPKFDVAALRGHRNAVQGANVKAQFLFERNSYMPTKVGVMNELSKAVSTTSFQLRDIAQTNIINLQDTTRLLKRSKAENGDPGELADIHMEMEDALESAFDKLANHHSQLKRKSAAINGRYDRAESESRIAGLEQERGFAEKVKSENERKLTELKGQIKSVSEGIDLIGKAGVEKIGKEAQLTLDNLQALGMAPPQVQVALLAVDTLKKIVSGIGDVISYLNMVAGYESLKARESEFKAQLDAQIKNNAHITEKIELINALDSIDDARRSYVEELENLVAAFAQFSRDFVQDKSVPVEERVDKALAKIPGIINYLRPVQS